MADSRSIYWPVGGSRIGIIIVLEIATCGVGVSAGCDTCRREEATKELVGWQEIQWDVIDQSSS